MTLVNGLNFEACFYQPLHFPFWSRPFRGAADDRRLKSALGPLIWLILLDRLSIDGFTLILLIQKGACSITKRYLFLRSTLMSTPGRISVRRDSCLIVLRRSATVDRSLLGKGIKLYYTSITHLGISYRLNQL